MPLRLRPLASMRARMTIGFVLVLAPYLLATCTWVLSAHLARVTEIRDRLQAGWIAERVGAILTRPDWRAHLSEMMDAKVPKESHVALLILDRNGDLVWRSPGPGPPWPPPPGSDWSRELPVTAQIRRARSAGGQVLAGKRERAKTRKENGRAAAGELLSPLPRRFRAFALSRFPAKIPEPASSSVSPRGSARLQLPQGKEAEVEARRREREAKAAAEATARKPAEEWRQVARFEVGPQERRLTLVIAQAWGAVQQDRAVQKRALTFLSLCVVFGVAAGIWVLVGRTLSPIRRLALQAGAASVENLQVRLKAPSRDAEVVELVDTLNGLLARLAETAAVKGRFYAAASHELRTPLQALSGHLEVSLSRGRAAEEYETFLQEASRQTERLTSLVKDLLLLHQLDSTAARRAGAHDMGGEPVDLAEVCDGALGQLAPLIEARDLRLSADLAPGAEILAVPTHAEILVRNLVENAVKYASAGGEVTLCLTAARGPARLEVFNACPPVPEWNPQKLFEPFYRPDAARNARTGGNGLGLAICRAIAAANGWTVTLQQEPRGVRATATFGEPHAGTAAGMKPG